VFPDLAAVAWMTHAGCEWSHAFRSMTAARPFLLLDPPSDTDFCRRGSLREKDNARNAPFPNIDLILLSGAVREAGFAPLFLDAQINRLSWAQVLAQAQTAGVCGMLSLTSSSRIEDELAQLGELKRGLGDVPAFVVGSIITQREPHRLSRLLADHPWLDGVILNTAEHNLTEFLRGGASCEPFNIAARASRCLIPEVKVRYGEGLRIPRPQHAIFKDKRYCFPQSKRTPVTCVQWAFGCPFTCEFCIDNQLYRKMLYRDVDDVIEELAEIDALGFREVYFKDLTFGLHRKLAEEFLEKLIARRFGLRWLCTTRVDVATPDLLALMKKAGCYGIEFGVEHANETTRRRVDKRISDQRISEVFANCRKLGIETTAFIMLGFEDDTEADVRASVDFARSLRPKYVSFNVVNALPGTAYEQRAKEEGFLRDGGCDYGFSTSNIKHRFLNPQKLEELRRAAVRSFYLRPAAILERIAGIRSLFEFRKLVRLGLGTLGT
jgi:radical SAM superfamily enzyme YgiQ (UPF0313 family)